MTGTPPAPGRPGPLWLVFAKLAGVLVVAGVLAAGVLMPVVGGLGLAAKHEADRFLSTTCTLQETAPPQKSEIYASDGKTLIATIFKQDRQPVPLDQIPYALQQALIATEDRRFYSHHGVDIRGLLRSAVSTSGGDTQGGSTLTMQYVKQIRYYQAGDDLKAQQAAVAQNLQRKIEDAKCALYIENTLHETKDKILDNYLNIAFFGENSYGIQTAAKTYFGVPASQLTLPQSALLVGLLRAPSQYDPFQYPAAARERRNEVLQNLVAVKQLSQAVADKYKATPIVLATKQPPQVREGCANAPDTITNVGFFCGYAVGWLLDHKVLTQSQLETGGYKIVTTLDATVQDSVQRRVFASVPATSPTTEVMPVLDPHTGDVLAMATSKKYGSGKGATSLPVFTEAVAQGASTWKLFPLLTALSIGVPSDWPLETPQDAKYPWQSCPANGTVVNGDAQETYDRNETLASATAKSENTYFVGIADQLLGCDLEPIIDMARSLGITSLDQPSGERGRTTAQAILAESRATQLVLGDIPTSPLEMSAAYAAVANGGAYNAPAPIRSITDQKGDPVAVPRTASKQVVAPQVAARAVAILTGDTSSADHGTSADAFAGWYTTDSSPIAGKTGTAVAVDAHGRENGANSALWFVGMTPDYVGLTALINFDTPNYAVRGLPGITDPKQAYGAYAAQDWIDAMRPTLTGRQWSWPDPATVPGTDVPSIRNLTVNDARAALKAAGFTLKLLDPTGRTLCAGAGITTGNIAYYAPERAPRGSTILACQGSGASQQVYVYVPPPTPAPPPVITTPAPADNGNGNGSNGSRGGRTTSPTPAPKPTKSRGGGNGNGRGGGGGASGGSAAPSPNPPASGPPRP